MLRCHTRPCVRHVYIRHAQTRKSVIEQSGDMTTQIELTEQGRLMAGSLVDGIRAYMQRKGCDPNEPPKWFGGLDCISTSQESILTYEAVKPGFPLYHATLDGIDKNSKEMIVCLFVICDIDMIRTALARAGICADDIGVPLGSATIIDELNDGTFFVHAIGDLGATRLPTSVFGTIPPSKT